MIHHSKHTFEVFPTVELLNKSAAALIVDIAKKSIAARGKFVIALSGGNTPEKLYALLAEAPFSEQLDWKKTFVFWGDERCVPLNDERNNAHMAKTVLLNKVNIPPANIHFIPVNLTPAEAAAKYEKELRFFFGEPPMQFDLILLGLGENGHTASLFPGTKVVDDLAEGIRDVYVEEDKMHRITMTAPLINRSRNILFLVTGEKKAKIVKKILIGSYEPEKYPAQLIDPVDGDLFWFVDKDAGSLTSAL